MKGNKTEDQNKHVLAMIYTSFVPFQVQSARRNEEMHVLGGRRVDFARILHVEIKKLRYSPSTISMPELRLQMYR